MVSYYNPALSMLPSHAPSQVRHSHHASAAAAVAAQTASYFPSAYSTGYHHQQFSAAAQYPNILDPNFNVPATVPQFAAHAVGSTTTSSHFDTAAQSVASSWHTGWGAAAGAPGPGPGSPFRSSMYGPDSWQTDLGPASGNEVNNEGNNAEHSPNPSVTNNESGSVNRTAVPASSTSPGFNNSQSSGSPIGASTTPTPGTQGAFGSNGPQPSAFMQASPAGGYKSDGLTQCSSPNEHFGLPSCITVTSQSDTVAPLSSLSPKAEGRSLVSSGSAGGRPQPARSPYEWMKKPSYQSQPEKNGRTRTKDKYRVVYSDQQRLELEKEFHYSRYITIRRKAELANNVGLSERQVKIWFQNRRAKERRALKKQDDIMSKEKIEVAASATMSAFTESLSHATAAAFMHHPPFPHHHAPPPPHHVGHVGHVGAPPPSTFSMKLE